MAIEEQVIQRCTERGVTLSTAEACTGGLIGALLVSVPGSSKVFVGGITAYHNGPKRSLLGLTEETARSVGSVSEPGVHELAEGARKAFGTTIAVAESGIAGPTGGSAEKPAGTVYIGIATPEGTRIERFLFPGSRRAYMLSVAETALRFVIEWLDATQGQA
ncbi:MAG TPA: CinA family protein [Dehalococcoidia bacterium]|nr:CinA family protein [Dehalococcoidia bacterium]